MSYWGTVMDSGNTQQYGRRLVPVIVDEIAAKDPGRICFSFPRSLNLKDGFYDLTFRTFSNAIDKTARFIEREIGRSSMFETVLYIGHPDVRYFIVLIALMKTGHKVLISSHHSNVATHVDLIKKTDCSILLYTSGFDVSEVLETTRMESLCMPELAYLLDDSLPCKPFPFTKTFDQAKNHPCLVMDTSNPGGASNPVVWTYWQLATPDAQRKAPEVDGRQLMNTSVRGSSNRCYMGLPVSHGTGVTSGLFEALYNNTTVVLGPPGTPTASTIDQIIEHGRIDAAVLLPATLEEIASSPTILAKLAQLKFITYTGAPLSKSAGDAIAPIVPLYSLVSSIWIGPLMQHATDRSDWQYICLYSELNGIEWRPRGSLFELVFRRDKQLAEVQGIFKSKPGLQEVSMGDLYSKHPSKPHHWKYEGRANEKATLRSGLYEAVL